MINKHNEQKNMRKVAMSARVKSFRMLALGSHVLLLLWLCIWYFVLLENEQYSYVFVIVIYLLPLLLPLHGIIKAKPYTHAWSCFIVLWYFLHSITTMYAEPQYMLYAAVELLLAIAMFVGCSMFARLRGQELGIGLPKLSKVMEEEKAVFESVNDHE